jgi:hypothetical protein
VLTPPLPLPPRSRRLRHAVANALPQRCHRCQRAADATVALPAAAALLPRCHSRRRAVARAATSAAAAKLPPPPPSFLSSSLSLSSSPFLTPLPPTILVDC